MQLYCAWHFLLWYNVGVTYRLKDCLISKLFFQMYFVLIFLSPFFSFCAFLRNLACLSVTLLRYPVHWSGLYSSMLSLGGLHCKGNLMTLSSQCKEKLCALCSLIWVTLRPFAKPHYNLSRSVGWRHAANFLCNHNIKIPWNRSCTGIPFNMITVCSGHSRLVTPKLYTERFS